MAIDRTVRATGDDRTAGDVGLASGSAFMRFVDRYRVKRRGTTKPTDRSTDER
jgi:hypothetical protein